MLRNNPGRRPLNHDEPAVDALSPACPAELTDEVSRVEWTRAIVPAIRSGLVTGADRTFAIAHCELWATWRSQLADAAQHAHVIAAGPNRYPMPNPARVMSHKTLQLLAKVDAELGFSPTARSRVTLASRTPQDGLEQFRREKAARA
jgi:P27 family predicted phage terminase small subunit